MELKYRCWDFKYKRFFTMEEVKNDEFEPSENYRFDFNIAKDENGVDVFSGDIIEWSEPIGDKYIRIRDLVPIRLSNGERLKLIDDYEKSKNLRVIGNMYEDVEMLLY